MKQLPIVNVLQKELKEVIREAMTYDEFRELVADLAKEHGTTGPEQSEAYKNYTELNHRRMKRWDKTLKVSDAYRSKIEDYNGKVVWLVITESWCGDAAPSLPVMNKFAQINNNIELRIILRSEYPQVMDAFLTDGKRSIPKLIVINTEEFEVLGSWGPLPSQASLMAGEYKKKHGSLTAAFKEDLQQWFNADKGSNTLEDLMQLLTLK
ncbi:thioredoxin family protein [Muriicola soli]|uniref:Thioredoxin family protein n=1 Tax=Muriicola soli TaxID=2507538 RepID=A0A411EBV7_9FLAO|nr:thioredoxin family protein [Muriicola soli]QBA65118.1 thioredoxin family protein [Muriicola soli]